MVDFSNCCPGQYVILTTFNEDDPMTDVGKIYKTKSIYEKNKIVNTIFYIFEDIQGVYHASDNEIDVGLYGDNNKDIKYFYQFADDEIHLRLLRSHD